MRFYLTLFVSVLCAVLFVGFSKASAQNFSPIADLNDNTRPSQPLPLAVVGDQLFFSASTADEGRELWVTDGTVAGTALVKDIASGESSALRYSPSWATHPVGALNGTLFFVADDGDDRMELWKSDGTESGTVKVQEDGPILEERVTPPLIELDGFLYFVGTQAGKRLWKTDGESIEVVSEDVTAENYEGSVAVFDGKIYFVGADDDSGAELWATDGTGAELVADMSEGVTPSWPRSLTVVEDELYFTIDDGMSGDELWKTDGTTTALVADIYPDGDARMHGLTAFEGQLYFAGTDGVLGSELWRSDGTEEGTELVVDIWSGSENSFPRGFTISNGALFFAADAYLHQTQLWKVEDEEASLVRDINPSGRAVTWALSFLEYDGELYFAGNDGTTGFELWVSDGTEDGTELVEDIAPRRGSEPDHLIEFNGDLWFAADHPAYGYELWKFDGTSAELVTDIALGEASQIRWGPIVFEDQLLFTGSSNEGRGLYSTDGTAAETVEIAEVSGPYLEHHVIEFDNQLYFSGQVATVGRELFRSDGTAEGTELFLDANEGSNGSSPSSFVVSGDKLFFEAFTGGRNKLWVTDGTIAGTTIAIDLEDQGFDRLDFETHSLGDGLVVTRIHRRGDDGIDELWRSDGTDGGTEVLLDVDLRLRVVADGVLYFSNGPDSVEAEGLWRSDGTSDGTECIQTGDIRSLSVFGDIIYFGLRSDDETELHTTDGTILGTESVGSTFDDIFDFFAVDDQLFFVAKDGEGEALFATDGTSKGTELLARVEDASNLTSHDDLVYFRAEDEVGEGLFVTDGTFEGTELVKRLDFGSWGAGSGFLPFDGRLYFRARTEAEGTELWATDGTAVGTSIVDDAWPGTESGYPIYLTVFDGELYGRVTVDGVTALSKLIRTPFIRGDADGNGDYLPILDALFILENGFAGGDDPPCLDAADADGNNDYAPLLDALYVLMNGFVDGPNPPLPFPDCGNDPEGLNDGVGCDTPPAVCP